MEKLIHFFVKDKLIVNIILFVIVGLGIVSMFNLKKENFPSTDLNVMVISVVYPGASAEDVEINAVIPIEDAISEIEGIDEFSSMAIDNMATIRVSLDEEVANIQSVKDEIYRDITLSNLSDIPEEVETLSIVDINPKMMDVMQLAITPKSGVSDTELYAMCDTLETIIKGVNGVSSVSMVGYRDREIHIEVDPDKMSEAYISLTDVVNSIKNRNVRATNGSIQSIEHDRNILTIGEFTDPMEVGDVIIRSGFEQDAVTVGSISKVIDGFTDADTLYSVNGKRAVILSITKKEKADIIKTVRGVEKTIKQKSEMYSDKFDVTVVSENASAIDSLVKVVASNAFIGFVLVVLVLLFFLDFRTSFWTAFSIPLCLLVVMIFMRINDYSVNLITLGAIITVLGMLVDDAIVVAETIYVKREQGMSGVQAAVEGVREVISPVTVTILSTIVAFLPLMMITGTMGKFIFIYPVIIMVTLLTSLAEATFILPNHLSVGKKGETKEKRWFKAIADTYQKFLKLCLKFRYGVLASFVLLLIGSIIVSSESIKNFKLMDDNTGEVILVNLEAPNGTSLDKMEELTEEVAAMLLEHVAEDELVSYMNYIGKHSDSRLEGDHENWSSVQITLVPKTERQRDAETIVREMRKDVNLEALPQFIDLVIREDAKGPSTGDPVDIKVVTDDQKLAVSLVEEIETFLSTIDGVKDITNDQKEGKDEILIKFKYDKLAEYDMTVADVSTTVRTAYEGTEATSVQGVESKLEFMVSIPDDYKKDEAFLLSLLIPNQSGMLVKLGEVAYLEMKSGAASRKHYNGVRTVTVSADIDKEKVTSMQVNKQVMKEFRNIESRYPGTYLIFGGEMKETGSAIAGLGTAFLAAIVMIYLIVLVQFRSVGQPLIVMSVVPFGLIGVLIAFTLHGVSLTFMAIIGVIGLSGVVINDSIIMVDFINKLVRVKEKWSTSQLVEKIAEGAAKRLRPIILTTVTTVAGLMPTVYGIGGDAKTLMPTVMAMAYGLLFATLLTLIFVPSLYMISMDFRKK